MTPSATADLLQRLASAWGKSKPGPLLGHLAAGLRACDSIEVAIERLGLARPAAPPKAGLDKDRAMLEGILAAFAPLADVGDARRLVAALEGHSLASAKKIGVAPKPKKAPPKRKAPVAPDPNMLAEIAAIDSADASRRGPLLQQLSDRRVAGAALATLKARSVEITGDPRAKSSKDSAIKALRDFYASIGRADRVRPSA